MPPPSPYVRTARTITQEDETDIKQMLMHLTKLTETMQLQLLQARDDLSDARRTISEMEKRLTLLEAPAITAPSPAPPTEVMISSTDVNVNPKVNTSSSTPPSRPSFAHVAARPAQSAPKPSRAIPRARAARLFSAPSPTSGYTFVYVPQKGRVPMNELRKSLSSLGINNSRILDIHFPGRNVCGLLVHNDFVTDLLAALEANDIAPIQAFNPTAADIIKNPAYQNETPEERQVRARDIHKARVIRIISRAPPRVKASLTRSFIDQGIIEHTDITNTTPFQTNNSRVPTHTHYGSDDDMEISNPTPNHEAPLEA